MLVLFLVDFGMQFQCMGGGICGGSGIGNCILCEEIWLDDYQFMLVEILMVGFCFGNGFIVLCVDIFECIQFLVY